MEDVLFEIIGFLIEATVGVLLEFIPKRKRKKNEGSK